MPNEGSPKRRAVHFFTFFDGGYQADSALSAWEAGVLPVQIYDTRKPHNRPEHALCYAVLEQAVLEFQNGFFSEGKIAERQSRESCAWFLSKDDSWPFSFEKICENLDIDSNYLRRGLVRMGKIFTEKKRSNMLTSADKIKIRPFARGKKRLLHDRLNIDKLPRAAA
ncbi:MAG: hypothetical protein HYT37_01275 [Candidatus Sungbacteria bacterium]|nr:hypothetical protein [Candidatus Sungbacteria bacterium]